MTILYSNLVLLFGQMGNLIKSCLQAANALNDAQFKHLGLTVCKQN